MKMKKGHHLSRLNLREAASIEGVHVDVPPCSFLRLSKACLNTSELPVKNAAALRTNASYLKQRFVAISSSAYERWLRIYVKRSGEILSTGTCTGLIAGNRALKSYLDNPLLFVHHCSIYLWPWPTVLKSWWNQMSRTEQVRYLEWPVSAHGVALKIDHQYEALWSLHNVDEEFSVRQSHYRQDVVAWKGASHTSPIEIVDLGLQFKSNWLWLHRLLFAPVPAWTCPSVLYLTLYDWLYLLII